jgi:hypothetical protein
VSIDQKVNSRKKLLVWLQNACSALARQDLRSLKAFTDSQQRLGIFQSLKFCIAIAYFGQSIAVIRQSQTALGARLSVTTLIFAADTHVF